MAGRDGSVFYGTAMATIDDDPADQMGTVTLSTQEPMAGTRTITANLTDADGMVSGQDVAVGKVRWTSTPGWTPPARAP